MDRQDYQRLYWPAYCLRKRRVSVTLTTAELAGLVERSGTRTPGRQLWLEAQAYRQQRYLPTPAVEQKLEELQRAMRQLYSQLTAHQTSILGTLPCYAGSVRGLRQLQQALDQFLVRPQQR